MLFILIAYVYLEFYTSQDLADLYFQIADEMKNTKPYNELCSHISILSGQSSINAPNIFCDSPLSSHFNERW